MIDLILFYSMLIVLFLLKFKHVMDLCILYGDLVDSLTDI